MPSAAAPVPARPTPPDYLAPYREMLDRPGPPCGFASLLWTSRQTQHARFQAITEMLDLSGRVVVDAGCGHGDFAGHLLGAGISYSRYLGIEALDEHLKIARAAAIPRAAFRAADFVTDLHAFESGVGGGGGVGGWGRTKSLSSRAP